MRRFLVFALIILSTIFLVAKANVLVWTLVRAITWEEISPILIRVFSSLYYSVIVREALNYYDQHKSFLTYQEQVHPDIQQMVEQVKVYRVAQVTLSTGEEFFYLKFASEHITNQRMVDMFPLTTTMEFGMSYIYNTNQVIVPITNYDILLEARSYRSQVYVDKIVIDVPNFSYPGNFDWVAVTKFEKPIHKTYICPFGRDHSLYLQGGIEIVEVSLKMYLSPRLTQGTFIYQEYYPTAIQSTTFFGDLYDQKGHIYALWNSAGSYFTRTTQVQYVGIIQGMYTYVVVQKWEWTMVDVVVQDPSASSFPYGIGKDVAGYFVWEGVLKNTGTVDVLSKEEIQYLESITSNTVEDVVGGVDIVVIDNNIPQEVIDAVENIELASYENTPLSDTEEESFVQEIFSSTYTLIRQFFYDLWNTYNELFTRKIPFSIPYDIFYFIEKIRLHQKDVQEILSTQYTFSFPFTSAVVTFSLSQIIPQPIVNVLYAVRVIFSIFLGLLIFRFLRKML